MTERERPIEERGKPGEHELPCGPEHAGIPADPSSAEEKSYPTFSSPASEGDPIEPHRAEAEEGRGKEDWQSFDEAREELRNLTEEARARAREVARNLEERGRGLGGRVRREVNENAERLKERGLDYLRNHKGHAAVELEHIGEAIHQAATTLRHEGDETAAVYTDSIARRIDDIAAYLRDCEIEDLWREARDIVQRRPALFIGGLALLGLAFGRFLAASSEPRASGERAHPEEEFSSYSSAGVGHEAGALRKEEG